MNAIIDRTPRTMAISCGLTHAALVTQLVYPIQKGVGQTICWECGGDGNWLKYHPEPELFPDGLACVDCKGTGWRYVSI